MSDQKNDEPTTSGDWKEKDGRKARVDKNRCAEFDGGKEWAVFKHTNWMGRWHYDGYTAYATKEEAEAARETWLDTPRPF